MKLSKKKNSVDLRLLVATPSCARSLLFLLSSSARALVVHGRRSEKFKNPLPPLTKETTADGTRRRIVTGERRATSVVKETVSVKKIRFEQTVF